MQVFDISKFESEKTILPGTFCKKGEAATLKDALSLGLKNGDEKGIFITDRIGNLALFNVRHDLYKAMNIGVDIANNPETQEIVRRLSNVRGWIQDISTGRLIARSFTEDSIFSCGADTFRNINWTKDYEFMPIIEGITVRIFHYNSKWYVSTHKKIDCFASKSIIPDINLSIEDMFNSAIPLNAVKTMASKLSNPNIAGTENNGGNDNIYIFQIVHPMNQIMNQEKIETPVAYHLATIKRVFDSPCNTFKIIENGTINTVDYSDQHNIPLFPAMCKIIKNYSLEEAAEALSKNKFVIIRKGFELTLIIPPEMQELVDIRGFINSDPYKAPELLYLRLKPEQRVKLQYAVPYHMIDKVKPEIIDVKLKELALELAIYCANIYVSMLNKNINYVGNDNLNKIVNQLMIYANNTRASKNKSKNNNRQHIEDRFKGKIEIAKFQEIVDSYHKIILFAMDVDGEFMYRCFKDMLKLQRQREHRLNLLATKTGVVTMKQLEKKNKYINKKKHVDSKKYNTRPSFEEELNKELNNNK